MKSQKFEFKKAFLQTLENKVLTTEEEALLDRINEHHRDDLLANNRKSYPEVLLKELSKHAGEALAQAYQIQGEPLSMTMWHQLVVDFHRGAPWSFESVATNSTESVPASSHSASLQKSPVRELARYILVFVQAGLVMKAIVLYFGLKSGSEEGSEKTIFLILALLFSFCSLIYFAWKQQKKNEGTK